MVDCRLSFSLIDMANIQSIHKLEQFRVLSDARRMQILRRVMAEPATLTQLAQAVRHSPAWVRHHLLVLENAGLVELAEIRTTGKVTEKYYRASSDVFVLRKMVLPASKKPLLLFSGSDDPGLKMISGHLARYSTLVTLPVGSLDGLINLRQGLCHLSGSHLLDESGEYNLPFIRHLFPDRQVRLVTLAQRTQGWMFLTGNPKGLKGIEDLTRQEIRFANRNAGSGTRLWVDRQMRMSGIPPEKVSGYGHEVSTHDEAAALIAAGKADVSIGLQSAAFLHGLEFVPLFEERYDIVFLRANEKKSLPILDYITSGDFRARLASLPGYSATQTGREISI